MFASMIAWLSTNLAAMLHVAGILAAGWLAAMLLQRVLTRAMAGPFGKPVAIMTAKVVRNLIIVLTFFSALSACGIKLTGILAAAGVAGVAIGFAAQSKLAADYIAIIGLSGTVRGAVALLLPTETAHAVVGRMLMTDQPQDDADVSDAIGEIVNMIAGAAKAQLEGHCVSISVPTVVRGKQSMVDYPRGSVTVAIPFDSELGTFSLNVSFASTTELAEEETVHESARS